MIFVRLFEQRSSNAGVVLNLPCLDGGRGIVGTRSYRAQRWYLIA
jgi:hypothetical protein